MTSLDENLYSRQIAVYGKNAMKSLTESKVLILGFNGSCLELCKNLTLAGVNNINLVTDSTINIEDLATNYFADESDIGKNIKDVLISKISELNPYVTITSDESYEIKNYDTLILCNNSREYAIKTNKLCRENNINFIWMNCYGLFSNVFCDFGNNFKITDTDGEQNKTSVLHEINSDGVVVCIENEPHNLSKDEKFIFSEVIGLDVNQKTFTVSEVISKLSFRVKEDCSWNEYKSGGRITSVKETTTLNFKTLEEQLSNPSITNLDEDATNLHKLFVKLIVYIEQFNELPEPWSSEYNTIFNVDYKYSKLFHYTCRGQFMPVCSIIGAYAAQECIKSLTTKYMPINQWFYYHCFDILPKEHNIEYSSTIHGDRYDSIRLIFGEELLNKIRKSSFFIVGSGAIGCEHLKNFSMTGIGTDKNSKLIVTDMDTIEKSNLNRQFLFRNNDIGKLKSEVAAREAKKMNKDLNIEWQQNKICPETEELYDKTFFDNIHGIANALDNIQARLYVDKRCIFHNKPLFESGTLGTKGNVQTIIPKVSEHYGASQDPQEKSFPVCTLKNFPNSIQHTIAWARSDFEELFTNMPNDWNRLQNNPDVLKSMTPNEKGEFINNINYMWCYKPTTFVDCIIWAINRFYEKFNHQIKQLLYSYPKDTETSEGSSFWSGGKRCPDEIKMDTNNQLHNEYVYHTALLLAEMFNIQVLDEADELCIEYQKSFVPTDFKPSGEVKVAANDEEEKELQKNRFANIDDTNLPSPEELSKFTVKSLEFEKDDDSNHHVDYINATSNLRATNYKIDPVDRYQTKLIAGKIIPAISTTTSIVSGLVTVEMIKSIFGKVNIEDYKNSFINLAINFTLLSEPMPSQKWQINEKDYTPWDYFVLEDDINVSALLNILSSKYGTDVDTIMYGSKMLISPMTMGKKKKQRLEMKLSEILTSFSVDVKQNVIYELQAASLMEDDDLELPNIKFHYVKNENIVEQTL